MEYINIKVKKKENKKFVYNIYIEFVKKVNKTTTLYTIKTYKIL